MVCLLARDGGYVSANHPLGHFNAREGIRLPFEFLAWTNVDLRDKVFKCYDALLVRVNPACFAAEDPLLVYADDYMAERPFDCYGKGLQWIERLSSGIADVQSVALASPCSVARAGRGFTVRHLLTFRLRKEAVKSALVFNGRAFSTAEIGEYILCLPTCDEFSAAMGEVDAQGIRSEPGNLTVPDMCDTLVMTRLFVDSYCMK